MRIIISPAKKMNTDTDTLEYLQVPQYIKDSEVLLAHLKKLTYEEAKSIWKCNAKIAATNYERIQKMNLYRNLTPAILSYEGIQYQYMAPAVFGREEYAYLEEHLRILSGFYGMLHPFDGVVPYRLEMQAKIGGKELNSLYEYWNTRLAEQLFSESPTIINLASHEYSKCISRHQNKKVRFITCIFGEKINNKIVEKGTLVKMARGEMVRFMAEKQIKDPEEIKKFNRLNFAYSEQLSEENIYIFIKGEEKYAGKKQKST